MDSTSRFDGVGTLVYTLPDGRRVRYFARRFLPQGATLPVLETVVVGSDTRLDLIAHETLGNPLLWWRIADANDAMDPPELTSRPGRRLRVPAPPS